jgi:hypothetical protein
MPPAPIYWLTVQKNYNDLVVATYGRGFWILDDITPLRSYDQAQASSEFLFKPRPTYRYRHFNNTKQADTYNHVVGENPPTGADLNFFLKAPAKKVSLSILASDGQLIRKLEAPTTPGINRIWWDLRYEAPTIVKIRNSPPGEPWVKNESGSGHDWRPLVHWRNYTTGPEVAPGTYTVKLDVDGKESTESLTILRDPKDLGSEQEIKANTDFLLQLRAELNQSADAINQLELVRKELAAVESSLGTSADAKSLLPAAAELRKQLDLAERKFFPLELTGRTEDAFRVPTVLYGKLTNLAFLVEGGADLPPTDQSVALNNELKEQLADARQSVKTLNETLIPAFNATLKSKGLANGVQP